jgi:hypothetical protein|tara:strand:- start:443 stop:553 length:111 start_codon:yes stop_codon:yes gene_type:complete
MFYFIVGHINEGSFQEYDNNIEYEERQQELHELYKN